MSGMLILLAVAILIDEPLPAPASARNEAASTSELLPAPRGTPPKGARLISTATEAAQAPLGAEECKVGWGVDPKDNTMYMVIQIAPSALDTFAAGERGQELQSRIPPALRNRIEKVIVRFGTGPVEQVPPESELVNTPLPNQTSPHIANLDLRSPVNIDAPRSAREVVPTASTAQIPIVPNEIYPSTAARNTPAPAGVPTSSPFGSPPFPSTANPTTTAPLGTSTLGPPPIVPDARSATQPPAWNNNTTTASRNTGLANDGFAPLNRSVPSTLNPFGSPRTNAPFPSTTETQGNVTYSGTNFGGGVNAGGNPNLPGNFGNAPLVASNPNNGIYPPSNQPVLPSNTPNPYYDPSTGQWQQPASNYGTNYGQPVSTNNLPYAANGYAANGYSANNPMLPVPHLANRQLPSTSDPSASGAAASANRNGDTSDPRTSSTTSTRPGSLVPFFLVLSFILNIYFGLWLNHLRTKYRHLLGSVRGMSPLELDRA